MKKILMLLMAIMTVSMLYVPITAEASSEDDVLTMMNAVRESAGLEAFTMDEDLQDIAEIRASECAQKFSHIRPNGKAWYTVSNLTNGENLAHAVNSTQQKPENVVYAWTLSPKHYANLVRSSFTSVGIAYYCNENGETFIACEFH
ncbi:SCP domain-containing protein [Butyrivibrio proteoclasticus B316]|uniref:SCP domain-containing protein n=1 Tax=Butyrivibrio proteoclasticus (strain ATCC 51982 / DSM 14932 / B316) TaxID=515622 RepID=E0RXA1_BUTPB|nr:CAP domain-containing protein [Butyrivibrio proteoclasticus]ADL35312.1 SCP domain-containing protein [Butyrivibrio proteoclasticus B316]